MCQTMTIYKETELKIPMLEKLQFFKFESIPIEKKPWPNLNQFKIEVLQKILQFIKRNW